ncbi:MAG: chorismate mutase [Bacteroidota bacterium]
MKPVIKPQDCKNLGEIREAIDVIDQEIVQLFAQRLEYVKEIVKFKSKDEEAIIARERREQVLKQRKAWAEEKGLDAEMMEGVFRLLIDKNIQIQFDITNSNNK